MKAVVSKSAEETKRWGRKFGAFLKEGDVVALVGDLGSGKTTFTKGVAEGLGVKGAKYVNSPSFVIIKEYEGKLPLYHFDLYRLNDFSGIETTGYEEYLWGNGVCVIEWAEKILHLLPKRYIELKIHFTDDDKRLLEFMPKGSGYKEMIRKLK